MYKTINKNWNTIFVFLLPFVYAIAINLYDPPSSFDLNRFYFYFHTFKYNSLNSNAVENIFHIIPDYVVQIFLFVVAKLHGKIWMVFGVISYITVFNFLWVFRYYYNKKNKVLPPISFYIYLFCAISIPAVLSGVRNIHALSFIAVAIMLSRRKLLFYAVCAFLWAALIHFSSYIYFLLYLIFLIVKKLNWIRFLRLKQILIFFSLMSFCLLSLKFIPIELYERILPESLFLKVQFYIYNNDEVWVLLHNGSWKLYLFHFFFNYIFIISFIILFWQKLRFTLQYKEFMLIIIPCILTFFYPVLFERYNLLLSIYLAATAMICFNKSPLIPYFFLMIVIVFLTNSYFFIKPILYLAK